MPIHSSFHTDQNSSIYIWQVNEQDDYFEQGLDLHKDEAEELAQLNSRKRSEWLASRYVLHIMLGGQDRYSCLKDEHGKPHLEGSDKYISLSHSKEMVAVMHAEKPCGIDIQYWVAKIKSIERKFISDIEKAYLPTSDTDLELWYMHLIWGAKEAIYKANGKKGIDFKNNICIDSFNFAYEKSMTFTGYILTDNVKVAYICNYINLQNYILVYAEQV